MKTFTMKEFELKEDKIFDLAKQAIHAHPHRRGRISKTNPKKRTKRTSTVKRLKLYSCYHFSDVYFLAKVLFCNVHYKIIVY